MAYPTRHISSKIYPRWRKYLKNQARYEKAATIFVGYSKSFFQLSKEYFLLPMPLKLVLNTRIFKMLKQFKGTFNIT